MRLPLVTALLISLMQATAQAQMPDQEQEMLKTMMIAGHNQLGILEFCQARGNVDADTVALQKRLLAMMPPGPANDLQAAEAIGKQGIIVFAGEQVPLVDAAKTRNTTPAAMCRQLAAALKTQAAQMPKP